MKKRIHRIEDLPVHDTIVPADIRNNEHVIAEIYLKYNNINTSIDNVRVWKISPIGGEFIVPEKFKEYFPIRKKIRLTLQIAKQKSLFDGLVVSAIQHTNFGILIGVRWELEKHERIIKETPLDNEKKLRWACDNEFAATVVVQNPILFNEVIFFKVVNISATGFCLKTSLRNKFIIPGMQFSGSITFPMLGNNSINFKIVWTRISSEMEKDILLVGAQLNNVSKELLQNFGQYVFQFGSVNSVDELRKSGLLIKTLYHGLNFSWVKSDEDYIDILKLRAKGYTWVTQGKTCEYEKMADEFDAKCRILKVTYKRKTVGTLRISFPLFEEELEQKKYVKFPENFPKNTQIVELTRVCTDPEFRKSDLLYRMIQHVIIAAVNAKRPFVLGSSPQNLLDLYKKMGAISTELRYAHEEHGVQNIEVILFNVHDILIGKSVGLLIWKIISYDCLQYLKNVSDFKLTIIEKARIQLYKKIVFLTVFLNYFKKRLK